MGGPGPGVPGQKVAILLPMTGPMADRGQVLSQAAQLALPQGGWPALDVIDTGGSAAGAAKAAQTAVANGDAMILGPLTSAETGAVAPVAKGAGIPVLAFTNDAAQSQPGVWPIGITPDQQVRRLVAAAQGQGKTNFVALLPDTDFGRAMGSALTKATQAAGLPPPVIRTYGGGMQSITAAIKDVSGYASRRGVIDAKIREARAAGTAEGRREAQEILKTSVPPPSFNVLLLAATGDALAEIASVLPYYDIDRSSVQILGPALWSSPSSGSGAVSGGWYAAPDGAARSSLEQSYAAKYGGPPPPLADLAYDAASIARVLGTTRGFDVTMLTQPSGFVGADGWMSFAPDGHVRRGLAVYRVGSGGSEMIEPAPQSASTPGS
ncbi:MAG: penicillin-binding protein activator [Proteobacteria bacterium]|nr:penicillin-binding protein activator [Pseudomonadota bacterium]